MPMMRTGVRLLLAALPLGGAVLLYLLTSADDEAPDTNVCDEEPPPLAPPSPGLSLYRGTVTNDMERQATAVLRSGAPPGSETLIGAVVARVEWHCYDPGGPRRPWGWHPGVTLYH